MSFLRDRSNSSMSWVEVPIPSGMDFSERRGSTVSSISMESSGTFGSYLSPRTPSEASSFGCTFDRYKSASDHVHILQDMNFGIYENLPTAPDQLQSFDVPDHWLTSNFLVSAAHQTHQLKPSPLPDVCKIEEIDLSAREYQLPSDTHEVTLSSSDPSYTPNSVATPTSESYDHTLWETHAFSGHTSDNPQEQNDGSVQDTLGHVTYHDHFHWQGQVDLGRRTIAPADITASDYTDYMIIQVKEELEDIKLSHTQDVAGVGDGYTPTGASKCQSTRTPRHLTVEEPDKASDQPKVIIGLDGKPQYVCGMVCKFPPDKDLTKETHIEVIGGDIFCTKAFARREHRTRHQVSERHRPTTRDGEGLYCPYPGCAKSREECLKERGKLPFAGNRKDNLDEHIVNTHCRAARHSERNQRIKSYGEACQYGFQEHWRRGQELDDRDALRDLLTTNKHKRQDAARACLTYVFEKKIIWREDKFHRFLRQRGKFDTKLVASVIQAIMAAYKRSNITPPKEPRRGNRKRPHTIRSCSSRSG